MKKLFISLALLLGCSFAHAALQGEEELGAQVIVRQVLTKKLLHGDTSRSNNKMLTALLEGVGGTHYTSVRITSISCEGALGSVLCQIGILDATDDGTESLSSLNVKIRQGDVRWAEMTVTAG